MSDSRADPFKIIQAYRGNQIGSNCRPDGTVVRGAKGAVTCREELIHALYRLISAMGWDFDGTDGQTGGTVADRRPGAECRQRPADREGDRYAGADHRDSGTGRLDAELSDRYRCEGELCDRRCRSGQVPAESSAEWIPGDRIRRTWVAEERDGAGSGKAAEAGGCGTEADAVWRVDGAHCGCGR